MLPRRDERHRRVGLALAPGGEDHLALRGQLGELVEGDEQAVGHRQVAQLRRHRHVADHALAEERDAAPVAGGQVEHLLDAMDVRGEGGDQDAPRRSGEAAGERRADLGLGSRAPGPAHIGRVRAEREHPALPQRGELRVVRLPGIHRIRVQLEVARVDHRAHRRLDGEADAVGDGVGHADRDDREAADLDLVPRLVRPEVRPLEHIVLGQARARERQGERRAVHGHVEVPQEIGQRPDVVLVAVRQHHRLEGRPPLGEVGEVGDHVVDARHLVVGEEEAAVDGDDVLTRLHQHHVEPDLAQPAERDQAHGGLVGDVDRERVRSVCGAHGGACIVPSAPAWAKNRGRPDGPRPERGVGRVEAWRSA